MQTLKKLLFVLLFVLVFHSFFLHSATMNPNALQQDLAINIDDGNAIAVWRQNSENGFVIVASVHPFGENWRNPEPISTMYGDVFVRNPKVAVDESGNAVAIWIASDGTNQYIESASYNYVSNSWSETSSVSIEADDVISADIAVDSNGNATCVWVTQQNSVQFVQSAQLLFQMTTWTETSTLSDEIPNGIEVHPKIAIDPSGNVLTLWEGFENDAPCIQGAELQFGETNWMQTFSSVEMQQQEE